MKPSLSAVAIVLCYVTTSCAAAFVEDQSNTIFMDGSRGPGLAANLQYTPAQVVTVGVSGHLAKIDLGVHRGTNPTAPLYVDIARTIAGQFPDFTASGRLATRVIAEPDVPSAPPLKVFNLTLDFSADRLHFATGDKFAIVLRSEQLHSYYGWWINTDVPNSYPNGGAYTWDANAGSVIEQQYDTQFRTWVAIPEPTDIATAAVGLIGLIVTRRHNN